MIVIYLDFTQSEQNSRNEFKNKYNFDHEKKKRKRELVNVEELF